MTTQTKTRFDLETLKAVDRVVTTADTWEDIKDWLKVELEKHKVCTECDGDSAGGAHEDDCSLV